MNVNIREVTHDDLDRVCQVEHICFPPAEGATRDAFETRIRLFPERFLVAEVNGSIVGIINGCCTVDAYLGDELYEPDCPHNLKNPWQTVFGLAVLPAYQHKGIAKALMEALVCRCRTGNQVGVILTCKQEKIEMYQHMGFSCRGPSDSQHGGAKWFDMVMEF